jgi:ribonuclease PH
MQRQSRTIAGGDFTFESGKLAKQADGACVVTLGETQVLATCTTAAPRPGIDFFPLTVDVEERMYAAGKIPGGFFRREGRPSETAILTARLTDRPLRPTFQDGFLDEVQVVITVLSVDQANPYDIASINAASLAVVLAGLPFDGPIGAVRMGLIGGQWKPTPTYQDADLATFDVVVAGRMNDRGEVDILMVEGETPEGAWSRISDGETKPTEEVVAEGLEAAKSHIADMIRFQQEFVGEEGIKTRHFVPTIVFSPEVYQAVEAFAGPRLGAALVQGKSERVDNLDALKKELLEHLQEAWRDEFASRACFRADASTSAGSPDTLVSSWMAVTNSPVPATLKSMSPSASSSPRMSVSVTNSPSSAISPMAMPATGLLMGTPASMSESVEEHTAPIEVEPFDSSTSDTRRSVYGNSSSSGTTGTRARSASAPWPISRRRGLPMRPTSPVENGGKL